MIRIDVSKWSVVLAIATFVLGCSSPTVPSNRSGDIQALRKRVGEPISTLQSNFRIEVNVITNWHSAAHGGKLITTDPAVFYTFFSDEPQSQFYSLKVENGRLVDLSPIGGSTVVIGGEK